MACASRAQSRPSTVARPLSGRSRPQTMRIAVVLPAPSGPMRPQIRPAGTVSERPRTARVVP